MCTKQLSRYFAALFQIQSWMLPKCEKITEQARKSLVCGGMTPSSGVKFFLNL